MWFGALLLLASVAALAAAEPSGAPVVAAVLDGKELPARLSAAALALALPAPGGTALRFNGGAADRVDLDKQIGAGTECDQALEFGKRFRINNNIAEFHAVNADAVWRVGAMEASIWRLNLFDSWEPAALRYREVMERTLGVTTLDKREPAWARSIRLITHEVWGATTSNATMWTKACRWRR